MSLEPTLHALDEGDDVEFVFRVTNTGKAPVELTFRSGLVADVVVYDATGEERWRWSDSRMFTQALESETLAPSQILEYTRIWKDPPSGEYTAVGCLEADRQVEARTTFVV